MEKSPLFPALYAIIVGLGMIAQWTISYTKNQIPELVTEPVRIGFHIAAEFVTAVMLMISGTGLLLKWDAAGWLYPLAIGMLLYTAIVSPGYFAQKGQLGYVWMFAGVILLALVSLFMLI